MNVISSLIKFDSIHFLRSLYHNHGDFFHSAIPSLGKLQQTTFRTTTTTARVHGNAQITAYGRAGNLVAAQAEFDRMPSKDVISWTALLTAYADNGAITHARKVFDEMPRRNPASWNAMISAYGRAKKVHEAFGLFQKAAERNAVTYAAMISGFARSGMMHEAEELYEKTPSGWKDPVAANSLLSGYLRCGNFGRAVLVFAGMTVRDVVSWSSMVDGYCKKGMIEEARRTFDSMPEKNVVSWTTIIRGYMKAGLYEEGMQTFVSMRRDGTSVNAVTLSVILDACAEAERSSDARRVFEGMEDKDLVSWNSMLGGYVTSNEVELAEELFTNMPSKDVISWTTMMMGFFNKGRLMEAVILFKEMPIKDEVAWTAVISGFVANEELELAFRWFTLMLKQGLSPNHLTLSCMLSASSGLAVLSQGVQLHSLAVKAAFDLELSVQNALISMYAKSGGLHHAWEVFHVIANPNVVSINAMITGLAQHGLAREAIELYKKMDCKPNDVTFLGLLSACSHAGMVKEGLELFNSMGCCYGLEPGPDHYTCMVDLLGRAGRLGEAMDLIGRMPAAPRAAVWGALLGASRAHCHLSLAEHAAERIMELEPDNAAVYTILSEMYAAAGLKKDEEGVRMVKKERGVRKDPGCSWITLENRVLVFLAGQKANPEWEKIISTLSILSRELVWVDS
ncbi:tetratricopeptide repeat (TPR)-like superfamily protein isoform X2 [Wolffia australiana]